MLNVCYRGCRQLFPASKILKNYLLTAEKINFEVGSKIFFRVENILEKIRVEKNQIFFNGISMKIENLKNLKIFSLNFH